MQGASDWEHHAAAEEEREEQEGFVESVNRLRREEGFDQMQVLNPVSWGEDSNKYQVLRLVEEPLVFLLGYP